MIETEVEGLTGLIIAASTSAPVIIMVSSTLVFVGTCMIQAYCIQRCAQKKEADIKKSKLATRMCRNAHRDELTRIATRYKTQVNSNQND